MSFPSDMTAPPAGALEACPFCGGTPQMQKTKHGTPVLRWIECPTCEALGAAYPKHSDAIAAWNRRTHSPALLAALRLREMCEGLVADWRAKSQKIAKPYGFVAEHTLGMAQSLDKCADDLARVLEEGEPTREAGSVE